MAAMRTDNIPVDVIRELLAYDPNTGILTWKTRGEHHFADNGRHSRAHSAAKWNGQYAGTQALTAVEPCGYLHGDVLNMRHKAHRVAWAIYYGRWPDRHLDHINGDPADNRICNLREVTPAENMRNQKMNSANKSGVMGVSWSKPHSKWSAQIKVNRRKIHLGLFHNIEEAAAVRKAAERRYGFHPNHGRAA